MVNERLLKQAIASVEMEGFTFKEEDVNIIRKLLNGEIDFKRFLDDCKQGNFKRYCNAEEGVQNESKVEDYTIRSDNS